MSSNDDSEMEIDDTASHLKEEASLIMNNLLPAKSRDKYNRTYDMIMGNILFSIIWLLILIFIGFWIAGIAAGFYILLIPFTVCIEALSGLTDFLLKVLQFPKYCAQSMVDGKGFN